VTAPTAELTSIDAPRVRSLVWHGDDLVDWVSGGQRYQRDGTKVERWVQFSYSFDAALVSPSGEYQLIYTRRGTKGLLLRKGAPIRELNRSFYHAEDYEYPVTLFVHHGRELLAHCPESYCRLEIDDTATGERLTASDTREPKDFFHSRLAVSPSGKYLISAGWVWHPVDTVNLYDVDKALAGPAHLDDRGHDLNCWGEDSSAAFVHDDRVIVSLNGIEDEEGETLPNPEIRCFDPAGAALIRKHVLSAPTGTIMAVGDEHVLALYEHPKLIEIASGAVIASWPEIRSGDQTSSIIRGGIAVPPIAMDTVRRRCAIADEERIFVLEFS
jgi:hypothetical protein